MDKVLSQIVSQFDIKGDVADIQQLGQGFINDTYIVTTVDEKCDDYLLQRKNKNVFRKIPGMMDNILKVTTHLKGKITREGGDPEREALTLVGTKTGALYFMDEQGEYWAMCILIKDHVHFENADTPELAESGGRGIGKFQSMMSDFDGDLVDTLPGFHNIRFRFEQWDESLKKDSAGRKRDLSEEISWIESRRNKMMEFYHLVESGQIPGRVTHNDTKISNILFDKDLDVLCVIDLDTVLRSPVLNDFGDAIRSYANTGAEDDKDLAKVGLDLDIFSAFTRGYLSNTHSFLTKMELDQLAFSALYICYEQVLRFLMDYIDGDTYYQIQYEDHNLVRTRSQFKLLQSMEKHLSEMQAIVEKQYQMMS